MIDVEAVKAEHLSKTYHGRATVDALKNVDLTIKKGELFTLLGQNGAGKTTFLRIISTQLAPTSGKASVMGFDVMAQTSEVKKHIAVVPQDVQTYSNFTPWEYCYYFSMLRGLSKRRTKEVSQKALTSLELWDLRNRTCVNLSGGEKKRAVIATALASGADVLLLDEPTSGLDAVARRKVWTMLKELVSNGATILLTTHIMEEAEILSDRLAIVDQGNLIAQGTVDEIRTLAKDKFRVLVEGDLAHLNLNRNDHVSKFGNKEILYFADEEKALELVRTALKKGLKAEAAKITLEDVFVNLVGRREEEA